MSLRSAMLLTAVGFLAACAGYSGRNLVAGEATDGDVRGHMGPPAKEWSEADGSRRLVYPRGPAGVHTFLVTLGADGRLQGIENVLDTAHFARIVPGMGKEEVLRILGPSVSGWTIYFPARDELVWEWRYCDEWNRLARFEVLFDGTRKVVRSTMSLREEQVGNCSQDGCSCAH